jgi:hypothetical protein
MTDYNQIINSLDKDIVMEQYIHKMNVKKEEERHYNENKEIYDRYKKFISYEDGIELLKDWWLIMDDVCSQYNREGHLVKLPVTIPFVFNHKLKNQSIIINKNVTTPHNWTVSPENYEKLKLSDKLKLFCTLYGFRIFIDPIPTIIQWK